MKKFLLILSLAFSFIAFDSYAKSYKFEFKHSYNVYQIQTGRSGVKVVQAWAIAGNADKAIDQCKQDAVAAAIFTGLPVMEGAMGVQNVPPLAASQRVYDEHKAWFDNFFKKGQFMEFVSEINSDYPTGENNISVKGGRQITILLGIRFEALRKYLQDEGILPKLQDHFQTH